MVTGIIANFYRVCVRTQYETRERGMVGKGLWISLLNFEHQQLPTPNAIRCFLDYTTRVSGTLGTGCVPIYSILKLQFHYPATWTLCRASKSIYIFHCSVLQTCACTEVREAKFSHRALKSSRCNCKDMLILNVFILSLHSVSVGHGDALRLVTCSEE